MYWADTSGEKIATRHLTKLLDDYRHDGWVVITADAPREYTCLRAGDEPRVYTHI